MLNDGVLDGDHFYYMISYRAIIFHYKPERVSFPFFVNLFKRRYSIAMIFLRGKFLMSFPVEIIEKNKNKKEVAKREVKCLPFQEYHHFPPPQSCCFRRDCKANVCVMARCITYFTMLLELLIIKNVKCVGVMLSTEASCSSKETTPAPFQVTSGDLWPLTGNASFRLRCYSSVLLIHDKMSFFKKSALVWFCSKWGTLSRFDVLIRLHKTEMLIPAVSGLAQTILMHKLFLRASRQ